MPERFWEIVDIAKDGREQYVVALTRLSRHDLLGFIWIMQYLVARIYPHASRPVEADTEDPAADTAGWAVAQGREYYGEVYKDPKKFPVEYKPDPGLERWAQEVFRARFHQDVPLNEWSWDDRWQEKKRRGPWA